MHFNAAANKSPTQHEADFNKPLGLLLEAQGVLSAEQADKSALVQGQMIAIRAALETGKIKDTDAKAALGEDRGAINFGALAKTDDQGRADILAKLGIGDADIAQGSALVNTARDTRGNINEGHSIAVPPIGFIHMDLHARTITNFGQIKQAALLAQRAIDATNALDRIETGAPDPQKGAARGFKLWGDESPELADIVTLCEELNTLEQSGVNATTPAHTVRADNAFTAARETFLSAGYPALAQAIEAVRSNKLGASVPTAIIATAPQENDNTPDIT